MAIARFFFLKTMQGRTIFMEKCVALSTLSQIGFLIVASGLGLFAYLGKEHAKNILFIHTKEKLLHIDRIGRISRKQ